MSTTPLENLPWSPRSPAERLLVTLKMRGPQTTAVLAATLGVTGEAVRQQLGRLAEEGLIEATAEPRGVGRPAQLWHLTAAGSGRFPDTHAQLTVDLLRTVRSELGEPALDRLIEARGRETRASYAGELAEAAAPAARVARLAAIRTREGYMAEWREEADGSLLLVENHCPICAAAAVCQGFCRAELAVFREVLGPGVAVEREEHILAGARRCAYRVTPRAGTNAG